MSESKLDPQAFVHVCVVVSDIESKVQAWADVLGLPVPRIIITDTVDQSHQEYGGQPSEARARIASFQLGKIRLELIEPVGGPSAWQESHDQHGDALHHLAFRVEGLEDLEVSLDSKGIPVVQRGDFTGGRYV